MIAQLVNIITRNGKRIFDDVAGKVQVVDAAGNQITSFLEADEIDTTDGNTIYKGYKIATDSYSIVRTTITGSIISTRKATGDWDDRTTLPYL